ncbi:serine/threonine protein kinase [Pontiella agarivorans]|uniref:Stress response kinase A n=1 Tax=Pontiella agarivorans TaxID=3038953 RepID=A0ABU5N081_9BACT|nr:serine/threonine protein kinase [Pontiella agarivorans]MDZ8119857.1 serine/threonine protein kinase [Pontiella agarivorans]
MSVFDDLTPDRILEAVETGMDCRLTGLTAPLPSYINRVYELETVGGEKLIAKFYRPGRWERAALQDEHDFVRDCAADEIPVVAPLELAQGGTIGSFDEILYAVFPKKSGREMDLCDSEGWVRLGRLVGRIHQAGWERTAKHRLQMHPETTTLPEIGMLLDGGFMSRHQADRFKDVTARITEIALREFEGIELQRIHGDCHRANILERPGEGLMVIDFDDMVMGPAVQDIWLLLPGHANQTRTEINLILDGYEQFMEFDDRQLRLIEILRAMRIIYFLSWCSTQVDDFKFQANFPDWGSEMFWQREIADLEHQYHAILNDERLNGGMGNSV